MADKIIPEDTECVLLVPAVEVNGVPNLVGGSGLVPITGVTSAVLNVWQGITSRASSGAGAGGNITAAIKDDWKLGLTDSDTDKDRVINSVGQAEAPTITNFDAQFNVLRNEDPADTAGVFNLAKDLLRAPDIPYVIVRRVGLPASTAFASDQEVEFYYVWTDNPIPGYGDGNNQTLGSTFIQKNVATTYNLAA